MSGRGVKSEDVLNDYHLLTLNLGNNMEDIPPSQAQNIAH